MAESKVEQLARETEKELALIKKDVESLQKDIDQANLNQIRERVATFEERLLRIEKTLEELKQVPVLEDRVNKLEKLKDESEKRSWQFVFIAVGAGCAVVGGVVVQLVSSLLKK